MISRDEPILLLFSPIFFLTILLFLAYYAQYFAQSLNICSKFIYIASYLTVISYSTNISDSYS